jgi:hypothetical protein
MHWKLPGPENGRIERWAPRASRPNASGGPVTSEPTRKSFGTRMMTSLGQQLKGKVELNYRPSGFVYVLDVPLDALAIKAKGRAPDAQA